MTRRFFPEPLNKINKKPALCLIRNQRFQSFSSSAALLKSSTCLITCYYLLLLAAEVKVHVCVALTATVTIAQLRPHECQWLFSELKKTFKMWQFQIFHHWRGRHNYCTSVTLKWMAIQRNVWKLKTSWRMYTNGKMLLLYQVDETINMLI